MSGFQFTPNPVSAIYQGLNIVYPSSYRTTPLPDGGRVCFCAVLAHGRAVAPSRRRRWDACRAYLHTSRRKCYRLSAPIGDGLGLPDC
jgi:hypothetical protein